MSGKKAAEISWRTIFLAIVGALAIFIVMEVIRGPSIANAEGIKNALEDFLPFGPQADCRAQENHFWCSKATEKTSGGKTVYTEGCLEWGKQGEEKANCDPRNYKSVQYNDICKEDCRVSHCPAGTGRMDNKCVACKKPGESCEGGLVGIGNGGICCAPELFECKDKGIVVVQGKCEPRANAK